MPWARSCFSNTLVSLVLLLSISTEAQRLDKPTLLDGFNDLDGALKDNLPKTNCSKVVPWDDSWILEDCKNIAEREKLSLSDIETFAVYYDDCSSPWILCRHKNSPDPKWHFIELFGRIPVRARSHVKGMIMLPAGYNDGYNDNNYIAIHNQQREGHHDWSSLTVMMHEVGHSLDHDAYRHSPLSTSSLWQSAYNDDSKVPDAYASTNFLEDVAQNTVIATYDLVVPGGLGTMDRDWHSIQHQYELIRKEQAEADTSNLLIPGGECVHRLNNSQAVRIPTPKVRKAARGMKMMRERPNTDLTQGMAVIVPSMKFNTKETCLRP